MLGGESSKLGGVIILNNQETAINNREGKRKASRLLEKSFEKRGYRLINRKGFCKGGYNLSEWGPYGGEVSTFNRKVVQWT